MIQQPYYQPMKTYPQMPSAVSININEPQVITAPIQQVPMQAPYNYSNQIYGMPQQSIWGQQPMGVQSPFQQYNAIPQQQNNLTQQYNMLLQQFNALLEERNTLAQQNQYLQQAFQQNTSGITQNEPAVNTTPVVTQEMPESVIQKTQATPPQPEVTPAQVQTVQQAQQTKMPAVEPSKEDVPKVNTDALIQDLKSSDLALQAEAMTSLAHFTMQSPKIAVQVLTEPIKQSLIDIINTDTTNMAGLTPEQEALKAKQTKGEKLTAEEEAQLKQPTQKDMANKNRVVAMFTLAMVQKCARDNHEEYNKFQVENGGQPNNNMGLKDLAGYKEIVNVIQNEQNNDLKIAGIQALQHIAKPEEKAEVETALASIINGNDAELKKIAQNALTTIETGAQVQETQKAA